MKHDSNIDRIDTPFEHAVRDAVLAQLSNKSMVDAITQAVLQRLEAVEDANLLSLLENEPDEGSVSLDAFLQALKS